MSEDEFDQFLAQCRQTLEEKQADLQARHGLDRFRRWQLEPELGVLRFLADDGGAQLSFRVTPIGTFATAQETWKWAWANSKLPQALRDQSARLKALQRRTDYDCFVDDEAFGADELMAWELAAASVAELDAAGCYRAPNRDTWLFLALHEVTA